MKKPGKIYNFIVPLFLIPLCLGLLTGFIEEICWLRITATIISTLLTVFYLVLTIHELRKKLDAHFNFQQRRINRLILGTRTKLQKIIARTDDASVMDYALVKLCEICPPDVYSTILKGIIEKERDPDKQKSLFFYNKQFGGKS